MTVSCATRCGIEHPLLGLNITEHVLTDPPMEPTHLTSSMTAKVFDYQPEFRPMHLGVRMAFQPHRMK
jgi:hypothetical protein